MKKNQKEKGGEGDVQEREREKEEEKKPGFVDEEPAKRRETWPLVIEKLLKPTKE